MAARLKILSMLTFCFYITGCSTYKSAALGPGCGSVMGGDATAGVEVESGGKVRLVLCDGEIVEGTFVHCDDICITLDDVLSRFPSSEDDGVGTEATRSKRRELSAP